MMTLKLANKLRNEIRAESEIFTLRDVRLTISCQETSATNLVVE